MEPNESYARIDEVVWFENGPEVIIHNLQNDTFLTIRGTGPFIWKLLGGDLTITQVTQEIVKQYKVEYDDALKDCVEFVNELLGHNLIARAKE